MPQLRFNILKVFISLLVFLSSGVASTYFYYLFQNKGGVYFPGLLYTAATVIIFILTKKEFTVKNLSIYYLLMMLVYLGTWLLTMLSSWFVFIFGPVTAGIGALACFWLTDKFITKLRYHKVHVFLVGALAFAITFILHSIFISSFDKPALGYIFNLEISPSTLFMELFIFWHVMVGTKLFFTLSKD